MNTFKKIWQSKTPKEMISNIPYSSLEWCIFIIISLITLNPLFKTLISLTEIDRLSGDFFEYWHKFNPYVLLYGGLTLLIYCTKLYIDGSLANIYEKLKKHPAIILFGIFVILMCISTAINNFPKYSLFGETYSGGGLFDILSYLVIFLSFIICITPRQINLFYKIFAFSSVVIFILTTYDYLILSRYYDFIQGSTTFSNSNHYGYYVLVVAMFFAMLFITSKILWNKIIYLLLFMFTTGILLLNDTFGCQIALLCGLIFICIVYFIVKNRFILTTLILIIAFLGTYFIGFFCSNTIHSYIDKNILQFVNDLEAMSNSNELATPDPKDSSGVARIHLWERTIVHISEKPLFGYASDGAHDRLKKEALWGRCHCDYLHYAVCFGIPAAIIYVAAIFAIYLRGLKNKHKLTENNLLGLCTAFAYLVSSTVANTMYYTAPFLFIMLGLGYYQDNKNVSD